LYLWLLHENTLFQIENEVRSSSSGGGGSFPAVKG
jgi:hypothetical protein